MKGNLRLSNFLTNMRWPFLIISIIVIGLEIANSALRAARASTLSVLVYICAVVYVIIAAAMASFFIYTGSRVVAQQLRAASLKESSASSSGPSKKRKNRTKWTFKAIRFILLAAGFLVLYCISIVFLAINVRLSALQFGLRCLLLRFCVQPIFWNPVGHYITWSLIWISMFGISLAQILAFKMPSVFDARADSKPTVSRTASLSSR